MNTPKYKFFTTNEIKPTGWLKKHHFRFTCEGRAVWFSNFTSWRLNPVHARLKRHFSVLSLENFMGSTRYLYFQSLVP